MGLNTPSEIFPYTYVKVKRADKVMPGSWKQECICFLRGDSDVRGVSSESCNWLVARNMDSPIS
jgi:hypothetical protein